MPSFAFKATTIAILAATAVSGVDISLHRNRVLGGSPCTAPAVLTCPNVPELGCCGNFLGPYRGVLFTGLRTTDEGRAHTRNDTGACGEFCNRDSNAVNLCVSCSQTTPEITGGSWESAPNLRARGIPNSEPSECVSTVLPSIAHIDGHDFSIYYNVPEGVSDQIVGLATNEEPTRYKDIPSDLLQYEIVH